ncbi:MAG: hypothetical protein CSA75_00585, partial [Sorangium cellulosum]
IAGQTKINDVIVKGEHAIRSGDVLGIGKVTLGFHGPSSRSQNRETLSPGLMRQRLLEETERFLRYRRPLAVMVVIAKAQGRSDEGKLLRAVSRALRMVDVVAWDGQRELWILFPETSNTAMIPAERVLSAVCQAVPDAVGGVAQCPQDGISPDGLIAAARFAAQQAKAGQMLAVKEVDHTISIGDRSIVAADTIMRELFELIKRVASSEIPVLVMGETGTGKEIVAQAVHAWSKRKARRLVSINCAAVPETLLESELFGHEKGAFSGATSAKAGLFEEASGGTVFLDEIGECSPRTQAELLRVLETKRFTRIGSHRERDANVRIIAATNRPLEQEIEAGRFRQDLYFRLNTATVVVPPLRDRPMDLPVLARYFLEQGCKREARESMELSADAMQRIALHDWPGNVREIRNLMDFVAATVPGLVVEAQHLPSTVAARAAPWMLPTKKKESANALPSASPTASSALGPSVPAMKARNSKPRKFRNLYDEIRELEKTRIEEALEESEGVRVRAAELIGVPLRTLVTKIKVYGLAPAPQRRRRKRK